LRRWQTLPAGLALAMPNPEFEGVARQIRASLVRAGGEALAEQVYGEKVKDGETMLTRIHHRQEEIGNPIGHVDIPPEVNTLANYSAAMVAGAPHPEAARAWLDFVASDGAFRILQRYGFKRFVVKPQ
jgi:ABC-type Fe3+ transport system substrate-binding protein